LLKQIAQVEIMGVYAGVFDFLSDRATNYTGRVQQIVDTIPVNSNILRLQENTQIFQKYLGNLPSFSPMPYVSKMSDKYNTVVSSAKDSISRRLTSLLERGDVRYVHGIGSQAFQQVGKHYSSAYIS
jgi:hypothetical protein